MHFEILVEDRSGKQAIEMLVPKIIGDEHTYKVHSYKGIGRIPKGLKEKSDAKKRLLLDELPRLLKGYGKTFVRSNYQAAVIVVCDLDNRCLKQFRCELLSVLERCPVKPETRFCIAIEEMEAWFLGDLPAIQIAYPKAKAIVLNQYENDSICGTWEILADAVHPGGSADLKKKGWQEIGWQKSKWAQRISLNMDPSSNNSPSFCYFREKLLEFINV